ncbi:MAG: 4-(cytidine 5'-diphospho)-2-C-methyl-D-erythritol kinase [Chloroflexi bacterium]|nr:4-(cytidine 5'-diphospho)-2-C-methyl-D-erythritol kinase [Chloroflexota bacterium]
MEKMALTLPAYAKINLTLEVLEIRPDGYHEIRSILQTISLADSLTFQPHPNIDFHCNDPHLVGPENMVVKAAQLLKESTGWQNGASIYLNKVIPVAAGLGGGSSDAAATFQGLNELWRLNLGLETLHFLAAQLGADVPFFLYDGTALAQGRGDIITPLPSFAKTWVVLLVPPHSLAQKTKTMYANLDPRDYTSGEITAKLIESLELGEPLASTLLGNVFQRVAYATFTSLAEYHNHFLAAGASSIHITGTGPVLFTLAIDKSQGEAIHQGLRRQGLESYLVQTNIPKEHMA